MGRRPTPLKLKLAKGRTPGRDSGGRRLPPSPLFTRYAPEPPETLSSLAREHWDVIVPELSRLDLLTPAHVGVLTLCCEMWALAEEALEHVRAEGMVQPSSQGERRSPWLVSYERLAKQYQALAGELGLSPSAEGRLGIKDHPGRDQWNPFAGVRQ